MFGFCLGREPTTTPAPAPTVCISPIAAADGPAADAFAGFGGRSSRSSASTGDVGSVADDAASPHGVENATAAHGAEQADAAAAPAAPSPAFSMPNPRLLTPKQLMKQVS